MTASPSQVQILNEADYQRYRVPSDLGCFGSLSTVAGVLPLQSMDLQGQVVGLLYHLKLVQRFFNPYGQPLEATYIFPLPGRAAVSSFIMQTQQRRVIGRLEERGEARRQYQQAIAQGKQAALAEEERSEVFTMTVGNIPPGEFVEIELELDGPLTWSDGEAMFRFPLVVAPRYIPGSPLPGDSVGSGIQGDTNAVPDASRISPPVLLPGYPNPVCLSLNLQVDTCGLNFGLPHVSMADLLCWQEPGGFRLSLQPTADRLDRDLIVRFPLPSPMVQSSLQACAGPQGHYFVLNLVPDDLHQAGPQTPRQVVALLDRSGSMSGWKMVCARRAVGRIIDSLTENDTFQVLNFDDRVEYLDPAKTRPRPASDRERFLALEQLGKVNDRGGTEILMALQAGVQMLRGQRDPYLVLITDGQVGNESEVLRWVQQNARGIRIFTVGIDRAVNASLLEQLAQVSGGHFTLVTSEEELDREMLGLRRRINPPLLQQVSIQAAGAECSPAQVDLFEGLCARQLGFLPGPLPREVEVIGYSREGRAFRNRLPVTLCGGDTVHKMWARERVLELEHGFLAGWRQPAYQPQAIAQFALRHGVLCRFTAFVAVDDQSYVPGALHKVTQAVSQPDGWENAESKRSKGVAQISQRSGLKKMQPQNKPPMGAPKPTLGARLSRFEADSFACAPPPPPPPPAPAPAPGPGFGGSSQVGGFGGGGSFADPFSSAGGADPFAAAEPCAEAADPFASAAVPFGAAPAVDLFACEDALGSPAGGDPFVPMPCAEAAAPLADAGWTEAQPARAQAKCEAAKSAWTPVPPQAPAPLTADVLMQRLRVAQTVSQWDGLLQQLIEALVRAGFSLKQLQLLQDYRQILSGKNPMLPLAEAGPWFHEIERLMEALQGPSRQDSFWK